MSKHLLAVLALATFAAACVVPVESQVDEEVGTDVASLIESSDPGGATHFAGSCGIMSRITEDGHVLIFLAPCERDTYVDMGDPWEEVELPVGTGQ